MIWELKLSTMMINESQNKPDTQDLESWIERYRLITSYGYLTNLARSIYNDSLDPDSLDNDFINSQDPEPDNISWFKAKQKAKRIIYPEKIELEKLIAWDLWSKQDWEHYLKSKAQDIKDREKQVKRLSKAHIISRSQREYKISAYSSPFDEYNIQENAGYKDYLERLKKDNIRRK